MIPVDRTVAQGDFPDWAYKWAQYGNTTPEQIMAQIALGQKVQQPGWGQTVEGDFRNNGTGESVNASDLGFASSINPATGRRWIEEQMFPDATLEQDFARRWQEAPEWMQHHPSKLVTMGIPLAIGAMAGYGALGAAGALGAEAGAAGGAGAGLGEAAAGTSLLGDLTPVAGTVGYGATPGIESTIAATAGGSLAGGSYVPFEEGFLGSAGGAVDPSVAQWANSSWLSDLLPDWKSVAKDALKNFVGNMASGGGGGSNGSGSGGLSFGSSGSGNGGAVAGLPTVGGGAIQGPQFATGGLIAPGSSNSVADQANMLAQTLWRKRNGG